MSPPEKRRRRDSKDSLASIYSMLEMTGGLRRSGRARDQGARTVYGEASKTNAPREVLEKIKNMKSTEYFTVEKLENDFDAPLVRARIPIEKGTLVARYNGEVISLEEADRREEEFPDRINLIYQYTFDGKTQCIDGGAAGGDDFTRYMRQSDHGFKPNIDSKLWIIDGEPHIYFRAMVDIPQGEILRGKFINPGKKSSSKGKPEDTKNTSTNEPCTSTPKPAPKPAPKPTLPESASASAIKTGPKSPTKPASPAPLSKKKKFIQQKLDFSPSSEKRPRPGPASIKRKQQQQQQLLDQMQEPNNSQASRLSTEREKEQCQSQQQQQQKQQPKQQGQQGPKTKKAKMDSEERHPLQHIFEKDSPDSPDEASEACDNSDDANQVSSSDMVIPTSSSQSDKQTISDLREQVVTQEGELNQVRDTLDKERRDNASLKRKLSKLANEKIMMEAENESLRKKLEGASDNNGRSSTSSEESEEKNAELRRRLEESNTKVAELVREKRELKDRLRDAVALHEVIFEEQEREIKKCKQKVCGLRMHVDKLKRSTVDFIKQEEISDEEDDD